MKKLLTSIIKTCFNNTLYCPMMLSKMSEMIGYEYPVKEREYVLGKQAVVDLNNLYTIIFTLSNTNYVTDISIEHK